MPSVDTDFAERYRALSSRDSRFDGQFIAGVHSTGIYCRPSCPAMTPREHNVRFYRTAAAAHEAGLRACKRCAPDAVPGSPEWNLRDDLASRAMRLISDGVVEREGVGGLASRLGYTPRHLARVLVAELGAGPLALARAHRAGAARTLLVATDLPIAQVAFAAGFASIRQFNDTILEVFRVTPSHLRAHRRPGSVPRPTGDAAVLSATMHSAAVQSGTATSLTLRLPARAPFDGAGLMRFFSDHAIPGLEHADDTVFERQVRMPHGPAHISVRLSAEPGVVCSASLTDISDLGPLVARVRRMFDLDADSVAIDTALASDIHLAPLVHAVPGMRLPGSIDAEETLFRTLVGQQVSVAAARTTLGRLTAELGSHGQFPTAAEILAGGPDVVRGPASRVATILAVARELVEGTLVLDVSSTVAEFTERLLRIPGIGPWTAGYLAMRVLGNPDVLLTTDLVLAKSATSRGLPAGPLALGRYGERWAPWRSYAAMHLWRARNWVPE
jgi:AraC family transcriptional regulator of adaptative response / DNA-3-methyladenine glycosylase II